MNLSLTDSRLAALLALTLTLALGTVPARTAELPADSLRIAIIPQRSHVGLELAYGPLLKALEEQVRTPVELVESKSYSEILEKLQRREVDVAYLGPFAYVSAHDELGARLLVRTLDKRRSEFYQSLIVIRRDSGIASLGDLRGKRFAFTDPNSTSGFLFPMVGLRRAGIHLNDFSEVRYVKRHPNSLIAVFQGQVDAGAISSTAKDKVAIDLSQIEVLWQSDPIYRGPWVARKDLPQAQYRRVQTALLDISERPDAEEILAEITTKGFVRGLDSDYDNVREVLKLKKSLEGTD